MDSLPAVNCAVHDDVEGEPCAVCKGSICDACATFTVNGKPACETCGRDEEERGHSLGSAILAFTGVGYLSVLVIGVLLGKARPYLGGIAAIGAIAFGRFLQVVVKPPVVERRLVTRG